ncbi:MAG: hypothetical protein QOF41_2469 [Methylobacteriaceae bacterium]|nr:hypothetical protein [Methylobacteriaceae bacterium]
MDLEHVTPSASPENAAPEAATDLAPRPRRRRKAKPEASPLTGHSITSQSEAAPEVKAETPAPVAVPVAAPRAAPTEPTTAPRQITVLSLAPEQRKPAAAQPSFFKRHGALAAGMALALGFGAYAGTQIGIEWPGASAAAQGPSVNVAAALPWKRDVAMASTQTREIARLKEELRGVRVQVDALKANPDQVRQAQELRSLRASLETLKEGLTATRTDTANAIAQVSSAQSSKGVSERDQQRIEKLTERLDRLERQTADQTPIAAVPPKAEAPKPVTLQDPHALPTPAEVAAAVQKAEPKAKLIHNYVVREVADGVALIEGPDGLREVWPGRGIPGAGKVTSIEKQAGKWVVITSEGLIEYRRDAYLR